MTCCYIELENIAQLLLIFTLYLFINDIRDVVVGAVVNDWKVEGSTS